MLPYRFTGKELDEETGLYYYGARYLDPKVSRWLSADPAMGDYLPSAPINDEARRRNGNLPGMGGVFNYVNLHAYHYAGNNPVRYTDPDGREDDLTLSTAGAEFIKNYEDGFYSKMYETKKGNGDWTIGYGHRITQAEMVSGVFSKGITEEQGNTIFNQDIQNHIDGIYKNVSNAKSLTQNQFDALVSASFNMGRPTFSDSEIVKTVELFGNKISSPEITNTDAFKIKIADSFRYHIPLGIMNAGIKERRYNEYQMFTSSDYKRDPTPSNLIPWRAGTLP
jgi:GH24 family phage-related lysozyme (muramidase)